MTVRVYKFDDVSAPTLTGASGSIISLLDACLVTGYGAKAGAGWTKPYTGTNKAVFRTGAGSNGMYMRVDASSSSQYPRFRGYETMTDVDTGTGLFPTDAQITGGGYFVCSSTTDSTSRPWFLVATEKNFYLYIGYNDTTATGLASSAYKPIFFFGDIPSVLPSDAFNTMIVCSSTAAATTNYMGLGTSLTGAATGHYLARSATQIGSAVATGKLVDYYRLGAQTNIGAGGATYPDPITGGLLIGEVYVNENALGSIRGRMPGFYAVLHNLPGTAGSTFSGTGDLAGKTFIMLDAANASTRCRVALETSDTW